MTPPATKERLRRAAWQIVRDHGLAAATSRRITADAAANLQSITYHYGSKEALLGEVLVEQLCSWTVPLASVIESTGDEADRDVKVAAAIAALLVRFEAEGGDLRAILRVLFSQPDVPGLRDAFATWLSGFRGLVVSSMAAQQRAGLIPEDVDVQALGGVFTALGLGVIAQSDLDQDAPAIPDLVAQFLRLLVRPDA